MTLAVEPEDQFPKEKKMDQKQMSMKKRLELWKAKKQQSNNCKRTVVAFGLTSSSDEKENVFKRKKENVIKSSTQRDLAKPVTLGRRNTLSINPSQQKVNLNETAAKVTRRLTLPNQNKRPNQKELPHQKGPQKVNSSEGPLQKRQKTIGVKFEGVADISAQPVKTNVTSRYGTGLSQKQNGPRGLINGKPNPPRNASSLSNRKQTSLQPTEHVKTINHGQKGQKSPVKRRTLTVQAEVRKRAAGTDNGHTRRTATVSTSTSEMARKKTLIHKPQFMNGTTTSTDSRKSVFSLNKRAITNSQSNSASTHHKQKPSSSVGVSKPINGSRPQVLQTRPKKVGPQLEGKTGAPLTGLSKHVDLKVNMITTKRIDEKCNTRRSLKVFSAFGGSVKNVPGEKVVVSKSSGSIATRTRTTTGGTAKINGEAKFPVAHKFENVKSRIDTGLKGRKPQTVVRQNGEKQNGKRRATFCAVKKVTALPQRRLSSGKLKGRRSSTHLTKVHFNTPKSGIKPVESTRSLSTPVKSAVGRDRLDEWLESKGKTPSRFQHLMCFQEDGGMNMKVKGGLTVAELNHQQRQLELEEEELYEREVREMLMINQNKSPNSEKVHNLLTECLLLLQSGCPADSVLLWLGEIESSLPAVKFTAKYYVLRSQIAEQQGATDAQVIDIFEEAVRNNASPPDEVSNALTEFVERMNRKRNKRVLSPVEDSPPENATFTPRKRPRLDQENIIPSSTVKYNLARTTPFFSRLRAKADGHPTPCGIVTPVRRSTRLSSTPLPSGVTVLDTLDDLSPSTKSELLFQPNRALQQDFESAI